jgi:hypothetical protein
MIQHMYISKELDDIWFPMERPSTTYRAFGSFVDFTSRRLAAASLVLLGLACSSPNIDPVAPWLTHFPITSSVRGPEVTYSPPPLTIPARRTPEKLAHIQARFGLNKTQLAQACQVQRQTIYDWYAARFKAEGKNAQRLDELYRISLTTAQGFPMSVPSKLSDKALGNNKSLSTLLSVRTLKEAEIRFAVAELMILASNRKPSLAQRRAALGLASPSTSERRENLSEALDNLIES